MSAGCDLGDGTIAEHCIDVSSRKETERELLDAKERRSADLAGMTRLLEHLGSWRWDLASNIVTWSPELFRIFGVDPETFVPSNGAAHQMLHPDDRARHAEFVALALAGKPVAPFESRIIRPNGEQRLVLASGFEVQSDESGNPAFLFGAILDVTERRRAEQAVQESEKRYRRLFETMQESFAVGEIIHDAEGNPIDWRYLDVNPAGERTFGRTRDEMVGRTHRELFPDSPWRYLVPVLGEVAITGNPARLEHRTSDNRLFEVIAYSPKRGQFASILADVSDRKRMEQERLVMAEKERAMALTTALRDVEAELARVSRALTVGELATSIAHEVNQPLAGIVTNAEACLHWIKAATPNLREAEESLALIVRDANRASAVIRRIREFLKKDPPRHTLLNINDVAKETVALVSDELLKRNVVLRCDLAEKLPSVRGDRIQLQQVILNLIMNGSEAMDSVADDARELLIVSQRWGADNILVSVRDSGTGIDPAHTDRIFDAFFTTKPTGMGMGLSISRTIVEAHGGRIWATPNDGKGLTVQFALPVEREGSG